MSAGDLKAKFEQDIKGATPKGTDTLRGNIRVRGSIPTIGPGSNFAAAQAFFEACETGKGWDACAQFCGGDAAPFGGKGFVGPLSGVKTIKDYTGFMQGVLVALPDCGYDVTCKGYDADAKTAFFAAVFTGTHTNECEGFPPPTNKSMASDYAYTLTFDGNGKICAMSKIWNDAYASAEIGWM